MPRIALLGGVLLILPVAGLAQLSIDTSNSADWKLSNVAINLDWSPTGGNVFGAYLAGDANNLVDVTNTNGNGQPKGFYMDNAGVGTGATTAGYDLQPGKYLDWWMTTASNSANAFTFTQHFVLFPGDPGIHAYVVFNHQPTDIAGSLGQVQYVFRINLNLFTTTYSYNSGLNNLGATLVPLPTKSQDFSTDPGRDVQDATVDLHGFSLPAGYTREFYTKYDFSSYEYLHRLQGVVGSNYGAWFEFPSQESMVGGPVKQDLIFTGNLLIGELLSDHLAYNVGYTPPPGQAASRLFGPIYCRFNTGAPAAVFQDALGSVTSFQSQYDTESDLVASGYVPTSGRGSAAIIVAGGGAPGSNTAWVVLGDPGTDFQFTNQGAQYWADNASGSSTIARVIPGTYRLSTFVLGQWGESRIDQVKVSAGAATAVTTSFTPENFGTGAPIWTIGSPTRSANKFRHGIGAGGQDDREYWGNWNYWSDFSATAGGVVYYATAVGSTPATNDLSQINYIHWHNFDPGLFGGFYNSSDDTTDGYKYIVPSYVRNAATASVPAWQVYFTTTAAQQAQGPFVVLSVSLAATNSDLIASLNGHSLTWLGYSTVKTSDAQVRSGLAGTHQWVVFQWPVADLAAAGQSNLLTLNVNRTQGVMYDALRMEIAPSGDPGLRGWNDYEYVTSGVYLPANDSLPNPTAPRTDRLVNLSARAIVDPAHPLSAGFIVAGPAMKTLVLRGIGPALASYGVANPLAHPQITLLSTAGTTLASNAGWGGVSVLATAFSQVGAFPLSPGSADSAVSVQLSPGLYTLRVTDGAPDAGGSALAEVYDASIDPTGQSQKLVNLSALGQAGAGTSALIGGFVVAGNEPKSVLIRGVGPALAPFGVTGVLSNPVLSVFNGAGSPVGQNSGWGANAAAISSAEASVGAFTLPNGSADAALIAMLPPGSYSAQVSGANGTSGTALVEIYELPE